MTKSTVSEDAVVIERTFDAPIDLIWQMWTDPENFKKWYGPKGFSVPVADMENAFSLRPRAAEVMSFKTLGDLYEIIQQKR